MICCLSDAADDVYACVRAYVCTRAYMITCTCTWKYACTYVRDRRHHSHPVSGFAYAAELA